MYVEGKIDDHETECDYRVIQSELVSKGAPVVFRDILKTVNKNFVKIGHTDKWILARYRGDGRALKVFQYVAGPDDVHWFSVDFGRKDNESAFFGAVTVIGGEDGRRQVQVGNSMEFKKSPKLAQKRFLKRTYV